MAQSNTSRSSLPDPWDVRDVAESSRLFEKGGVVQDWEPLGTWLQRRTLGAVLGCHLAIPLLLAVLALAGVGWMELVAIGAPAQLPLLAVIQRTFRPRRTEYSSSSRRRRTGASRDFKPTRTEPRRPK